MLKEFYKKQVDCYIIFKLFSIRDKRKEAVQCFRGLPENRMEDVIIALDLENTREELSKEDRAVNITQTEIINHLRAIKQTQYPTPKPVPDRVSSKRDPAVRNEMVRLRRKSMAKIRRPVCTYDYPFLQKKEDVLYDIQNGEYRVELSQGVILPKGPPEFVGPYWQKE